MSLELVSSAPLHDSLMVARLSREKEYSRGYMSSACCDYGPMAVMIAATWSAQLKRCVTPKEEEIDHLMPRVQNRTPSTPRPILRGWERKTVIFRGGTSWPSKKPKRGLLAFVSFDDR